MRIASYKTVTSFSRESNKTRFKKDISQAALVARRWARRLRPVLFFSLGLESSVDIEFLRSMLRSETSAWLKSHIHELRLSTEGSFTPSSPNWCPLLGMVSSSLRYLELGHQARSRLTFLRCRPTLARLCTLQTVTLSNCHFPSFSSLLRVLGSIRNLRHVDLLLVTWLPDDQAPRATCNGSFGSLRYVSASQCTDNQACITFFAIAGTHQRSLWKTLLSRRVDEHLAHQFQYIFDFAQELIPSSPFQRFDVICYYESTPWSTDVASHDIDVSALAQIYMPFVVLQTSTTLSCALPSAQTMVAPLVNRAGPGGLCLRSS